MKKLLLILLTAALLGGVGYLSFLLVNSLLDNAPLGSAMPVSTPEPSSNVDLNVTKGQEPGADALDAIAGAMEQNRDTVGWLTVPGTRIDGSVLQSYDNAYYLRRNEKKESDVYGCYFADCTGSIGSREVLSPNTVIYGHSDLTDGYTGPRFSQLFRFTDQTFAENHPIVHFSTPEESMTWEIFAVFYTDTSFEYIRTDFTPEELAAAAGEARARSLYLYDAAVTGEDKILTLSTCTVKYGAEEKEQRFVVLAKLLPPGEEPPQTASLTPNPSPKEPEF